LSPASALALALATFALGAGASAMSTSAMTAANVGRKRGVAGSCGDENAGTVPSWSRVREVPVESRGEIQLRVYKGADWVCAVFGGGECARQQRAVPDGKAKSVTLPAKPCRSCLHKLNSRIQVQWRKSGSFE
jgi:hypothetical protein